MKNNKKNIYFFQFNFNYGNEVFIPYSIGLLWSYVKSFKEICENYTSKQFIFMRESPEKIVLNLDKPNVCALSCYTWNWEINVEVSRLIKEKFPNCLIVFGGPHIPDDMTYFFDKYPFVDITVHGEGEITFHEILKENIKPNSQIDFKKILGLTFNNKTKKITSFIRRDRIKDINNIPSPYLSGVFEEIIKLPYNFQPIWETNRGCPYKCTYCDWGSSFVTKLKSFDIKRLEKEIHWFGENKLGFIFGADANFGILERDLDLAKMLSIEKEKSGFPCQFRVAFAKNSSNRVFEIAKVLNKAKMDKGITLSVQSLDKEVLTTVKRKNLKFDSLTNFFIGYQKAGIPTYTELIMALPGESYNSFKEGIDKLFEAGIQNSLIVYDCVVLPNAPMNDKQYKKEHLVATTKMPIFLNHSLPGDNFTQEYEEVITSTRSMPKNDYRKANIFSWIVQTCHTLNLTQFISIYLYEIHEFKYSIFYEEFINFAKINHETMIGQELGFVNKKLDENLQGKNRDTILEEFSDITWALDEASYLRISKDLNKFFLELKEFIDFSNKKFALNIEKKIIDEIITYQKSIIVKWNENGDKEIDLTYPFHEFYKSKLVNKSYNLEKGKYRVRIIDELNYFGNKKKYAKEVIWWGRKGGKFIYQNIEEIKVID